MEENLNEKMKVIQIENNTKLKHLEHGKIKKIERKITSQDLKLKVSEEVSNTLEDKISKNLKDYGNFIKIKI